MNLSKYTTLVLATVIATSLLAQETGKTKKGGQYFDGYSYTKAIEKYEAITDKTTDNDRRLAESYAHVGNTEKAEMYYMKIDRDF